MNNGTYGGGSNRGTAQFLASGAPIIGNMLDMQQKYSVINWNQWEFIEQSLYDSYAYPAAGAAGAVLFFQVPQGSGTGFGGAAKSLSDTNMTNNGMLPSGQMQLVTSVELEFQPTTPTVTAGMPAVFGAQLVATQINDAYIFWRSGNLVFKILQKNYVQEAPLMRFPATDDFSLQAAVADATTAATASQSRIGFASSYGQPYVLSPNNILIPETTSFQVSLSWPEGAQAITNPARVFCHLNGMQARQSQ
jgi:hypothetical protein